jgi:hypothetical protein
MALRAAVHLGLPALRGTSMVFSMSIMVVQLVPEGLLLGADRNVTTTVRQGAMIASGQAPRPKVLKWPNREIVVGYVGRAQIGDEHADEWLYDFIGRNLDTDLADLAYELKSKLEFDLRGEVAEEPMTLHLAGFAEAGGQWKPQVWFVRNMRGMDTLGSPINIAEDFEVSEEIDQPIYFQGRTGDEIRARVEEMAQGWNPFWFHQGYDLGTFNTLDHVLRAAMRAVIETHPGQPHPFPATLPEWSKHLKMAILAYGAYFAAFYEPFQQYVGGGADVVWAAWPSVPPFP